MLRKSNPQATDPAVDTKARLVVSDEDKGKAKQWFVRAREWGDKKQYDAAIDYYVHGLEFWPDAVEEACKPLHGCAVARRQTGGKKPGLKDSMTRSTTDKNVKQALLNSYWLFAQEPDNISYIEAVARNASRLRADAAAKWAGGILQRALEANQKATTKQFVSLADLMEELGDRAAERVEVDFGVEVFQIGVEAVRTWMRRLPKDPAAELKLKSLSTKLTILRGKYQQGESYRDSIVDTEEQKALHDIDRSMQADERVDELVVRAEAEYRQNPELAGKLKTLVDLLCRRERAEDETKAIGLLVAEYRKANDYRWKQLADDIRMRQLGREVREAAKGDDKDLVKEKQIAQLRFELAVFKERVTKYPTDNRLKFDYAVRNFRAGRFDDAIPLFQAARSDPKNRAACGMYLGRCFFKKGYHSQASSTLEETIREYEVPDDDLAKTMRYWLGRSQEAAGDPKAAARTYGELLKMDYNYLDVRARLDSVSTES